MIPLIQIQEFRGSDSSRQRPSGRLHDCFLPDYWLDLEAAEICGSGLEYPFWRVAIKWPGQPIVQDIHGGIYIYASSHPRQLSWKY